MAIVCARCGTQNPDGNQFCQACGTPLAATQPELVSPTRPGPPASPFPPPPGAPGLPPEPGAGMPPDAGFPPPPPAGLPPPAAFPPPPPAGLPPPVPAGYTPSAEGYLSPYYAASAVGPQHQVHRMSWILIVSAIVGLVVIMAGCGTAIALIGANRNSGQTNTTGIKLVVPSPTPGASPSGSPSPNVTPSPPATPTPTSVGNTASNTGETVPVPSGWSVVRKDGVYILLADSSGAGSIKIGSAASSTPQTALQNKDAIDKALVATYPDAADCPNSKTETGTLGGASGIFWEVCFTLTSGGQSVQAAAPFFAGANADGSVFYVVMLLTRQDNLDSFITEAGPILQGIQWNLQ
jgi:hypothetical protein